MKESFGEKGISPFVAAIILIAMGIGVGIVLSGWYTGLISQQSSKVGGTVEEKTTCTWGGVRILTETIQCDFGGSAPENLNFSLQNSGSVDLHSFKAQVMVNNIAHTYTILDTNNNTFDSDYPLEPDQIKTVKANISEDLPLADAGFIRVTTHCSGVDSGKIKDVDCTP